MDVNYFSYLFGRRWPMHLVALAGIVIAILRRKRHRRVSLLAASGFVLFLAQSITFASLFYLVPRLHDRGVSYVVMNNLYLLISLVRGIFYAGVIALLVSAVLSQRPAQRDARTDFVSST